MNQKINLDTFFEIQDDWSSGGGFTGKIGFVNKGKDIKGWRIEFYADFDIEPDEIWRAKIVSHVGNRYVIEDLGWNSDVDTDETISFVFNARVKNKTITEPTNFKVNQQEVGIAPEVTEKDTTPIATNSNFIGEIGKISDLNHSSRTIKLKNTYVNPVVFALPLSQNGGDPAIARITDIQGDKFSVHVQEAEYNDGYHTNEAFSYMVVEAGTWKLDDGSILQVGTVDTNKTTASGWKTVNFDTGFSNTPVVLSQVQTDNDDTFVRTRQHKTNKSGFQLALEEEEKLSQSGHETESVGWLAIESGKGSWNGMKYQAGTTGNQVTDQWYELEFSNFDKTPNLLAGLGSYNGVDSAGLRYTNLDSDEVEIRVEEDTSRDRETKHTSEVVNFLAIDGFGKLTATAYDSKGMKAEKDRGEETEEEDDKSPKFTPTSDDGVSRPSYNKSKGFFTLKGKLYDANGNEFVPRGVNNAHARLDKNGDGVDRPYDDIDNIASFGANSIRIQWYAKKNNPGHLEKIIQKTIDHNMVPLVDATHDLKGKTDPNQLLNFGVKSITDNADIYQKYEKYALIEIGSEFGDWKMSKNQRKQFPALYKQAITKIRDAGINNTLVISPFHWGKDYTLIEEYGREIYEHDPQKNIMFDVHFYSGEGESKAKIADAFDSITGQKLPFLIGEFASEHPKKGWKRGTPVYDIEDEFIMAQAEEHGAGYYPWCWNEWEPELGRLALANWGADSREDLTPDGRKIILDDPNSIANTAEIASIFE